MLKRSFTAKTQEEINQERAETVERERAAFRKFLDMEARGGQFASVQLHEGVVTDEEKPEVDEKINELRKKAVEKANAQRELAITDYVNANMCHFKPSADETPKKSAHKQTEAAAKRADGEPLIVQTRPPF